MPAWLWRVLHCAVDFQRHSRHAGWQARRDALHPGPPRRRHREVDVLRSCRTMGGRPVTAMDGDAVLAAMRGSAEFTRLQSANWLLQQQNRDLQRKCDTLKAERDNWRARCGR